MRAFFNRITGKLVTDQPPPCHLCRGVCCSTEAGWRFVELTYAEQRRAPFKKRVRKHPETGLMGFWFLRSAAGGYCPFFDKEKRQCGIYEQRPQTCRAFDCRACDRNGHFIQGNPELVQLIISHENNQ